MDRIRDIFHTRESTAPVDYTPLEPENGEPDEADAGYDPPSMTSSAVLLSPRGNKTFSGAQQMSWFDYSVFLVLGVAMLWAWNCFLAAAAYFQMRFKDNKAILDTFQSSIMTVSTGATLITTLTLSYLQKSAHYPRRIIIALIINSVVFILFALSTVSFTDISAGVYLAFTLLMVLGTAVSAGFFQNGLFAYVGCFDPIYTQGVMSGQGVAGVLPSIAQMVAVLAIPPKSPESQGDKTASASPKSAFVYFLTATAVSCVALFLFFILVSRHKERFHRSNHRSADEPEANEPKEILSLLDLIKRLPLPAYTIFFNFALTMVFPVFTQATLSVNPPSSSVLSRPEVFIPFSFLIWNTGDLIGRVICGFPRIACTNPTTLAIAATVRVVYIPLYWLGNIKGRGAKVQSDFFYELVQFTFGLTNGYVGSNTMMLGPQLVPEEESAAAGGFMGLCLVAGLAVGSAASFLLSV
ncbi:uncharacterized protein DFL_004057 [Arthrobotrys flagrans]|uniref:Nucleoside transporter n=1 Tax=Arthrobotrys flagrans TaxID=97331 RepID=A0A437A3L5_ARTFL|nr:hypothetical protein DFL_004057 [Arthrobotrys flagrans]